MAAGNFKTGNLKKYILRWKQLEQKVEGIHFALYECGNTGIISIKENELNRKLILSIIILIPIGFYSKFYNGIFATWVNNSLGGTFYVIFWTLLARLVFPNAKNIKIVLFVLLITCALEFTQLWQTDTLQLIRATFIGRTLIGNSFHWSDMIYYLLGSILSWIWINYLEGKSRL